ncbi:MAG: glutamate cyclase domain-containing protein [Promethearchaeota archaeon]
MNLIDMIDELTKILIGVPFLKQLPESAQRAYKIITNSDVPVQKIEEIASCIKNQIKKFKIITIFTGFYTKNGFETDGPPGALILADFFLKFSIPVQICSEIELLKILKKISSNLGLSKRLKFTPFEELSDLSDSMIITIERPGQNIKGIYHSMDGNKITHIVDPIELKIKKSRNIFWIAIGDGGNELGTGYYRETVEKIIPFGHQCICGCGFGIAAYKKADRCILATTSNFGAIAIALILAKQNDMNWNVSADKEQQIIEYLNKYGIKDGTTGGDKTVDNISYELRKKMLHHLASNLNSNLNP